MKFMQRPLAWFLSAMLLLMPMMSAQAAMIGTDQIINHADSSLTQERLQQFLDQEVAQQQLLALGVSPDWIVITDVIGATNIFTFIHPVK